MLRGGQRAREMASRELAGEGSRLSSERRGRYRSGFWLAGLATHKNGSVPLKYTPRYAAA